MEMMGFEWCVHHAADNYKKDIRTDGLIIAALEALAAERAAEREAREKPPHDGAYVPGQVPQPSVQSFGLALARTLDVSTPYTRATAAPRLGGQHPHDGRHVMSYGQWGMW